MSDLAFSSSQKETIAAQATAPGRGGVGIIRVSGPEVKNVALAILGKVPELRKAEYLTFRDRKGEALDQGIAIYFKGPNSFTGEDILELQGHGGPIILDMLLKEILALPKVRMAAIDFPEEEIDFLADEKVVNDLKAIITQVAEVKSKAQQGSIIREGMRVVIAGRPNAGKSSLLNALSGKESAIVTDIEGTTRDVLTEQIHIDGMPLHIIDTAGLRESADKVEQIGIERAWQEIKQADRVLLMIDSAQDEKDDPKAVWPEFFEKLPANIGLTIIRNKADISQAKTGYSEANTTPTITLSAKTGEGVTALTEHLKHIMGYQGSTEGGFMARRRHLVALEQAHQHLEIGLEQLESYVAGEILAEELRFCQEELNKITGEFTNDDLLSQIFSSFCIGK